MAPDVCNNNAQGGGRSLLHSPSLSFFPRLLVFGPLSRDLRQIALICYVEELSESSRKLGTNVLYLTQGDSFGEYPDDDTSMERRVWQVDTLSHTHQLEKFIQCQFCTDSRIR
jgi:hypothetical protein